MPRSSADSTESASRDRVARRTIARSTTTSIRCLRRWLSFGRLVEADRPAVDPDPGEARAAEVVPERVVVLAVAALDRGHDVDLRPLGQVEDLLDDLVGRLGADRQAAARAIGLAEPGEEDAQVVVDLGHGADRRPRALAGRLLLDADGRREAADPLDLRLLQAGRGTAGRSSRGSRRTAAAPRRKACRSPASSCPTRSARCRRSSCAGGCRRRPP